MADDLLLSLKSWPSTDTKDSLPFLISRINEQRGSFRDITEESLAREIRALETRNGITEEPNTGETVDAGQDTNSQKEDLVAARLEILKQVATAQMECGNALEFVSLLLSKHTPVQAQLTMSPFLKQHVPVGSLGAEVMQAPQVSEEDKRDDKVISVGWKMQSLSNTADSLLKSATRLEQEMELEAKYWEQVLAVKEEGWSLCRLPREKHILGVRFGFAEAYSDFRDRGLAALRRDDEGNIKFDRGIKAKSRRLRVRVLQQGMTIAGEKKVDGANAQDMPITKSILQARNSIFDEELHHELHREARNLANQGVRCDGEAIMLPYKEEKKLVIDLVPLGSRDLQASQADASTAAHTTAQEDDVILKSISISLRVLLSHAHHQNLERRSQPPLPVRETKPSRPVFAILKPILEIIRHLSDVQVVRTFLEKQCDQFSAAGLNFHTKDAKTSPSLATLPSIVSSAATEALVKALTAPLYSSITLQLPSCLTTIEVKIHTDFLPQTMGTDYQVTVHSFPSPSTLPNLPERVTFLTSSAFEDHVLHILLLDLVSFIPANIGGEWTITSPHDGYLVHRNKQWKGYQAFTVKAEKEFLSLEWRKVRDNTETLRTFRWGDVTGVGNGEKGMLEVIKEALEENE